MLDTIFNLALIVLGFGILIFFHELGHFLAAKWAGIRALGFAVGMGPVIVAWRRGLGLRFGSTAKATEDLVKRHIGNLADNDSAFKEKLDSEGGITERRFFETMDEMGLGETEYSLRWLPIGGFVRMLGQEDANPKATSNLPGSYTNCPVGKRMIVVSAGVIANLILAVVFFMGALLVGVPMEAPIVGFAVPDTPASTTMATNAAEFGITEPGLQSGDYIESVDGDPTETFNDVAIAAAMGRPDQALELVVRREIDGEPQQLVFNMTPEKSDLTGLLGLGIAPASSTTLVTNDPDGALEGELEESGLAAAGVKAGMTLRAVDGETVNTHGQFADAVKAGNGEPVTTEWVRYDDGGQQVGAPVTALLAVDPSYSLHRAIYGKKVRLEAGLLGLTPLTRIKAVNENSPSHGEIKTGDVVIRVDDLEAPRLAEFQEYVQSRAGEELKAIVLREGTPVEVVWKVGRDGRIGVRIEPATDLLKTARPMAEFAAPRKLEKDPIVSVPGPLDGLDIWALTTILAVNDQSVSDWPGFRAALREVTQDALATESGATVNLRLELPTPGRHVQTTAVALTPEDVAALHELGWETRLVSSFFETEQIILSADGNPIRAIGMGFERTHKFVINTYLTIDRLFRGTVGVEQLRGPVGIVHLGTQIADRGFWYLVFFLAMISVNLAVINFLPLPIVDGGLFLFLIYEKFKGRPPSVVFQNWATIAGLAMIVTLFLVVTYNDVARLVFT